MRIIITAVLLAFAVNASAQSETDNVVFQAMQDELKRSMTELQLPSEPKPYFVSYRLDDWQMQTVSAALGALEDGEQNHVRMLTVELRVGDYQLDNGNFTRRGAAAGTPNRLTATSPVTLDDNYGELRRQLWLLTDSLYKSAVEEFAQKKAALETQQPETRAPDFSREEPARIDESAERAEFKQTDMEKIVRDTSAVLRGAPKLLRSRAEVLFVNHRAWFLNSEGSRFARAEVDTSFIVDAVLQADNGRHVQDFRAAYVNHPSELPPLAELLTHTRAMRTHLENLRKAPELDLGYSGPVLFEDQAAAELVLQALVPAFIAARPSIVTDPELARRQSLALDLSFTGRIGRQVLPEALTLIDDPTIDKLGLDKLGTVRTLGGYRIDDQGVPARRKTLVERGLVKELLADRSSLVEGIAHSSGNARDARLIVPSNVLMHAEKAAKIKINQSREALLKLLREEAKDRKAEFGIVVRRIDNPRAAPIVQSDQARALGVQPLIAAYKVFVDGREELLRNVELQDLNLQDFMKIIAIGTTGVPYATPFSAANNRIAATRQNARMQPTFGRAIVSASIPSLLFSQLQLGKQRAPAPPLPKIPAPE